MKQKLFTLALLALGVVACSQPVGPAEQIGRGIDQIATGLMEIDRKQAEREAEYKRKYPPTPAPGYYDDEPSWQDEQEENTYNDNRRY